MHKLKKGIKKKIKGKKDKKDNELFTPEELEEYKKRQAQKQKEAEEAEAPPEEQDNEQPVGTAAAEEEHEKEVEQEDEEHKEEDRKEEERKEDDEEWQKFKLLTSGLDSVVKKTKDDLEDIKEHSYFQKKLIETPRKQEPETPPEAPPEEEEEAEKSPDPEEEEEVEEEENVEDDDALFDTAYVDEFITGDVKLAYIPDSPTEDPDDDDPFDTAFADKIFTEDVKKEVTKIKKKKAINLGSAVSVLSKVEGTPVLAKSNLTPAKRRKIVSEVNLLGDCEEEVNNVESLKTPTADTTNFDPFNTDECLPVEKEEIKEEQSLLDEFDVLGSSDCPSVSNVALLLGKEEQEDEVDEFAELAAESVEKSKPDPFDTTELCDEDDPFDTSAVSHIVQDHILKELDPLGEDQVTESTKTENKTNTDDIDDEFDQLANESVIKDLDPFDTTSADTVLKNDPDTALKSLVESDDPFNTEEVDNILQKEKEVNLLGESDDWEEVSTGQDIINKVVEEPKKKELDIKELEAELLGGLDNFNTEETSTFNTLQKLLENSESKVPSDIQEADPFDTDFADDILHDVIEQGSVANLDLLGDIGKEGEVSGVTAITAEPISATTRQPDPFDTSAIETDKNSVNTTTKELLELLESKEEQPEPYAVVNRLLNKEDLSDLNEPDPFDTTVAEGVLSKTDESEPSWTQFEDSSNKNHKEPLKSKAPPRPPKVNPAPVDLISEEPNEPDPFDTSAVTLTTEVETGNKQVNSVSVLQPKEDLFDLERDPFDTADTIVPTLQPTAPQSAKPPPRPKSPDILRELDPLTSGEQSATSALGNSNEHILKHYIATEQINTTLNDPLEVDDPFDTTIADHITQDTCLVNGDLFGSIAENQNIAAPINPEIADEADPFDTSSVNDIVKHHVLKELDPLDNCASADCVLTNNSVTNPRDPFDTSNHIIDSVSSRKSSDKNTESDINCTVKVTSLIDSEVCEEDPFDTSSADIILNTPAK